MPAFIRRVISGPTVTMRLFDMPFVIASPCVADYSCVEVCPVDCIAPGPADGTFLNAEQLYIDPGRCIECGVCVDVCPVAAIFPADGLPQRWAHYADVNRDYFTQRETERARP
jgi:ferredoxin